MFTKSRNFKSNDTLIFALGSLLIIVIMIVTFFIVKKPSVTSVTSRNLKIVHGDLKSIDHKTYLSNINQRIGDVFIHSGRFFKHEVELVPREKKHIIKTIEYPFLSPNTSDQKLDELPFITSYYSAVNNSGDFVFMDNLTRGIDNEPIAWYKEGNDYIKKRTNETVFLKEVERFDISDSRLIMFRYLFNNNNAIHINYISRKVGMGNAQVQAFINFLNFVRNYLQEEKIFYFSISGFVPALSSHWRTMAKLILKDSCYISPGSEEGFLTINDTKYGARASDFIIISKGLAPYGVKFYLMRPILGRSSKPLLVAEILQKGKDIERPEVDETIRISDKFFESKKNDNSVYRDNTTTTDVKMDNFYIEGISTYLPDAIK